MNRGGFSWKRFLGISALKAKVSRQIGIPLTSSGRQRKIGAMIEKLLCSFIGIKKRKTKS
ncbi:hypothetical protein B6V88_08445 [Legionella micdadei]|nr:hypothetical protein B6V88_08445 [Legionella micdadei]